MPIYKMEGKKDGQQKYRVRVNYKDALGNNKQIDRVVYGSENAKILERQLQYEIKDALPDMRISIQELYTQYIAAKKYDVRESTLRRNKQFLTDYVVAYFKDKKLNQLSSSILQNWKTEMQKKELAISTRKNIFSEFKQMLNYAVRMDYISTNPLAKINNFKDAYSQKKEINYYTTDEFKKFINAARLEAEKRPDSLYEWNYYVFFNIAFYTGMRKGEINALKWTDIDNNVIHITRSISQKLSGGDRETPPKNKSSIRNIQIPQPLKEILDRHYHSYIAVDGFTSDWRVCGGIKCLRDSSIEDKNKKYATLAGIKKIRIHDFRHSHASLLANEGINIQEIARRLGHSQIEITWNTYSHLYPQEEERAIKILNKIV